MWVPGCRGSRGGGLSIPQPELHGAGWDRSPWGLGKVGNQAGPGEPGLLRLRATQ